MERVASRDKELVKSALNSIFRGEEALNGIGQENTEAMQVGLNTDKTLLTESGKVVAEGKLNKGANSPIWVKGWATEALAESKFAAMLLGLNAASWDNEKCPPVKEPGSNFATIDPEFADAKAGDKFSKD